MDFEKKFDVGEADYQPTEEALRVVLKDFGLSDRAQFERLTGGYSNTNFKITDADNRDFVLRILHL